MYCPTCNKEYEGKFCPECGTKLLEKMSVNGLNVNGSGNAIDMHTSSQTVTHDNSVRHDSHNDNSQHYDQRGMTQIQAGTYHAAQTTEQDVVLKKEDRYRALCRRVYEDYVIDENEMRELGGLAMDLGLSEDRAQNILNGVKQQMDAERAKEEVLTPRAQKRLQRLLNSMRENDVEAVSEQLETFDEMVTEKTISDLHFVYYLAQAALNCQKCIALAEKSISDSYWRSYWSYVAYMKNGNKKEANRILDRIESRFSDYSLDNTALLSAVGELMMGNKKAADSEFLDVDESKLSPRLQRLFETLWLILAPAEAKENNLREKDHLFYLKNIFDYETTEEREKKAREEQKAREAEERRLKAEAEAKRKAEEKARLKAEQEAQRKREEEERKRREEEERLRKEAEAKRKAEEKARLKVEQRKREEEERKRREEEERLRKEAEAKRKREEEERRRAEEYRKRKEEERAKAELEAKRKAEDKSTITVSKTLLNFSAAGGSETVDINASGFWQLSVFPDNWAIVEELSNSIVIEVLENESEKERADYLKIKCGYKEVRVDIKQDAREKKNEKVVSKLSTEEHSKSKPKENAIRKEHDTKKPYEGYLFSVKKNDGYEIVDVYCNKISDTIYDEVYRFNEGVAIAEINKKYGCIDAQGNAVIPFKYTDCRSFNEGILPVLDGRWGYIDKSGKQVIPCIYDKAGYFQEGLAWIEKNGYRGFIDKSGKQVIPCIYDEAGFFHEGLAWIKKNGYYGFIDKSGKEIVPCKYLDAHNFFEGMAVVKKENKHLFWNKETGSMYVYVDKTGKEAFSAKYFKAYNFSDGLAYVSFHTRHGFIDKKGKLVIDCTNFEVESGYFIEKLACIIDNGKLGFIDKQGNILIPCIYDYANNFHNGLAAVEIKRKWGFIDKNGNMVIPATFDWAWDFTGELAVVERNGKKGCIDIKGEEILPCIYDGLSIIKTPY